MHRANRAREELRSLDLDGLRKKRLQKYNEALQKQQKKTQKTNREVRSLNEDQKQVEKFKGSSNKGRKIDRVKSHEIRDVDSKQLIKKIQSPKKIKPQDVKDAEEQKAKTKVAKLLDKAGKAGIMGLSYKGVRKRYLEAIEACRPVAKPVADATDVQRQSARREHAIKKDQMKHVRRVWDTYEVKAQDRPSMKDVEEIKAVAKLREVEDSVDKAWIGYATRAAKEAEADNDKHDVQFWIAEAKRFKTESEARRLAKLEAQKLRSLDEQDGCVRRKTYGSGTVDGILGTKERRKTKRFYFSESDSDSDDAGGATYQRQIRKKSYGELKDTSTLGTKHYKKSRIYDSDSESDDDDVGGATFQREVCLRRKNYGASSPGGVGPKLKTKYRIYGSDSDSDTDDVAGASFQRRLKGRRKNYGHDGTCSMPSKHYKKNRIYDSNSDSDTSDSGGATFQRTVRRKNFGSNASTAGLGSKTSTKYRLYGSDSDSDTGDSGGATFQRKITSQRKDFGKDGSGLIPSKNFKKNRIYASDSDSDSSDSGGASFQRAIRRKDYGDNAASGALGSKKSMKYRLYGSDSESDSGDSGGASFQRKVKSRRKDFGKDGSGSIPSKHYKKNRIYASDSDSDSSDSGGASFQRAVRRKDFGGNSAAAGLGSKKSTKYRLYGPDSESDSGDSGGAAFQRKIMSRKKDYGNDDAGSLPVKHCNKKRVYGSDSSSDSNDEGGAEFQREIRGRRRKNYGRHDSESGLGSKKSGKFRAYGSDSESDEEDPGGAHFQRKVRRKNFETSSKSGRLSAKHCKKKRIYGSESESDSDDVGGATFQNFVLRRKATIGKKPTYRVYGPDSDSDENDTGGAHFQREVKRQRKKFSSLDEPSGLGTKQRKKKFAGDDGSDSDEEPPNRAKETSVSALRKNFLNGPVTRGSGRTSGVTSKWKKPVPAPAPAPEVTKKPLKKFPLYKKSGAGVSQDAPEAKGTSDQSVAVGTDQEKKLRRKQFGGDDSDNGPFAKHRTKAKHGSDSDSTDDAACTSSVAARRKKFIGNDSGENLGDKKQVKSNRFGGSDESDTETSASGRESSTKQSAVRKKFDGVSSDDEIATKLRRKSKFGSDSDTSSEDEVSGKTTRRKKFGQTGDSDDGLGMKKKSRKDIGSDSSSSDDSDDGDDASTNPSKKSKQRKKFGSEQDGKLGSKKKSKIHAGSDGESSASSGDNDASAKASRKNFGRDESGDLGKKKKKKKSLVGADDSDEEVAKRQQTNKGKKPSFRSKNPSERSLDLKHAAKKDTFSGMGNSVPDVAILHESEYLSVKEEKDEDSSEYSEYVSSDEDDAKKKKTKKKAAIELNDDDKVEGEALNLDGSPWKNPLKGWTNMPKKKAVVKGSRIIMRAPPKTDFWRKTYHKGIVDTAPFYWQKVTGNFRVQVKISGTFAESYHKAGIMARLDEKNWIMTGMEMYNDRLHHSTSRTIDYTDWSLAQLPHNAEKAGVWFCFKRVGTTYECYYSFDAVKWILTRLGNFTARPVLYVGVCCASPRDEDFRATFDYYTCQTSGYM